MTAAPPTKKTKLFETSDNPDVELIFEHVDQIQEKIEKLVDEEADKILEVQMDFINKRKPIFEERNNIIRQIPGFWLKANSYYHGFASKENSHNFSDLLPAFCHLFQKRATLNVEYDLDHPYTRFVALIKCSRCVQMLGSPLAILIQNSDDKELLGKYLIDFRVEESQPGTAYRIIFEFSPNPWLKSSTIWKEFRINEDGTEVALSGPVEWHSGKDLMKKRANGTPESFFMFFATEEQDFEIGNVLKDKIYQNPMMYYSTLELEAMNDFEDDDDEESDELEDGLPSPVELKPDPKQNVLRSAESSAKALEASNHSTTAASQ